MVRTLWFSYSMEPGGSLDSARPYRSPYERTWYLGRFLREKARERGWAFRYVNLDDTTPHAVGPDDIVLGHLWFNEGSFIQRAFDQDCRLKLILQPYTHKMVGDEALPVLHRYFDIADWLFLITGPYWFDTMPLTPFARWRDKATRIDNAVNPQAHPFLKRRWNPPGKRRAMAVGYDNPAKGMDVIADIARTTGIHIGVFGAVGYEMFPNAPTITCHGGVSFTPDVIQELVDEYDFFLSTGRFDANPTTLNETACWGLIGACTPQSGYWPDQPFYELSLDDMILNYDQIDRLQHMSERDLWRRARMMRDLMVSDYNADKVCATIWDKIEQLLT